jgi:cysteine/O-acetylserine efflux protein
MTVTTLIPVLSYVLISTFSPGPNNISSASLGVLYGYRNTLRYMVGISIGVFCMLFLSGWVSTTLLSHFPTVEPGLRLIGAGYILYLAVGILKANYTFKADEVKPLGFAQGLLLQLFNPKLIVYGLTLFSVFLAPLTTNLGLLLLATLLLTATAFCATSSWALFGTIIKRYLHQPRLQTAVNVILSLLLVYTALELAEVV